MSSGIWELTELQRDQVGRQFDTLEITVEAKPGVKLSVFFKQLCEMSTMLNQPVTGKFNDRRYPAKPGMTEMDLVELQLGSVQKSVSPSREAYR